MVIWRCNFFTKIRERLAALIFPQPRVGIAAIVFNEKGQVLLGKRCGRKVGGGCWQVGGGHLEWMEGIEDCAIRELAEETGLVGSSARIITVTNNLYQSRRKHYVTVWVHVLVKDASMLQNLEVHKCEGWDWFPIDSLPVPLFEASEVLTSNALHKIQQDFAR